MNTSPITLRSAVPDDHDAVVVLTRQRRNQLAEWEPVFWRKRAGSDENHASFLHWCLSDASPLSAFVAVSGTSVVGCVIISPQPRAFFDDLCVADPSMWATVGAILLGAPRSGPALLCAPSKDTEQQKWLTTVPQWVTASYSFSIVLTPSTNPRPHPIVIVPGPIVDSPVHPFGGSIDPALADGLRIANEEGIVIGDASVEPPIYDPGGPTTVIDRIVGQNREALLNHAIDAAGARGDAQLIVVADVHDDELIGLMSAAGGTQPVVNWVRG